MIAGKYQILSKIGEGKFGQVFEGVYQKSVEKVAIKIENTILEEVGGDSLKLLKQETTILNYLYSNGCRNIPFVYWFGLHLQQPTLIMTYYEQSLHDYINSANKNKSTAMNSADIERIVMKMVDIVENIHSHFVIHRDIKPQNFMMKGQDIYLIDFGLATIYVDENKNHILDKKDKTTVLGTPKFISIHIHDGLNPSRRDDLISIGYIYMYMIMGCQLPWQNIMVPNNSVIIDHFQENHILHPKNQERRRLKSWTVIKPILEKIGDKPFDLFMESVYNLGYSERPNYKQLR